MWFDPRQHPVRAALVAAVVVGSGYALARLAGDAPGSPGPGGPADAIAPASPPRPPPAADDPLNRAILIEGGRPVRRRREAPDTVLAGPRSTRGEGDRGAVASFWVQEHEVTNEEYRRHDPGHEFPDGEERHPVASVTWEEAMEYAMSLEGSLPTEAEWQFMAGGIEARTYPWGDEEPTCERAWYRACGSRATIPVMSRPAGATPEGVHDLAGNVWEWVRPDWFVPGRTPVNDESRRMRGGSFDDEAFFLRVANRSNDFFAGFRYISVGFRVVWSTGAERD